MRRRLLGLLGVLSVFSAPVQSDTSLSVTLASIADERAVVIDRVRLLSGRLLAAFYERGGNRLVWVDSSQTSSFLDLVEQSAADGFRPDDFHAERVRRLAGPGALESMSEIERTSADIILSDALLRYVHHHRYGKVDPVALDPKWHDRPPACSEVLLADMAAALNGEDIKWALSERFPRPFWYENLKLALSRYEARSGKADLSPLPGGANLAEGIRDPGVAMIRERLGFIDGQEPSGCEDADVFDGALRTAVTAFQRRSGLTPDGVVGPATLAALNAHGDEDWASRIRINLERIRWLSHDLPEEYVFVDVAGFSVNLAREGRFLWSTRAIVGTPETQTPMFRDTMDHLVFNPTWTVPASIQRKMGRISSDFRVVDRRTGKPASRGDARDHTRYLLVQQPGPKNALGRVKFMFPNRHAVYLHDTPARALFERQARDLSNGCVRIENPLELAETILSRSSWSGAEIGHVLSRGRTRYVPLTETLPVLLYYLTAFADDQGRVGFRRDLYGRDPALREAFSAAVTSARIAFPDPSPPSPAQPD
jgi:L,D-transpeptidase YcbB